MTLIAMMWPAILLLASQLALPLYSIHGVWRGREETRWLWHLNAGYSGAYVLFVFLQTLHRQHRVVVRPS